MPVPVLTRLRVPLPSCKTPEKFPEALLSPVVRVTGEPWLLVMVPAPESPLRVRLKLLTSSVPLTVTSPFPVPEGMAAALASCMMPVEMVVPPE